MRYKTLVTNKLDSLSNSITSLNSLLSQQNLTRDQLDNWIETVRNKIADIQTLINTEQED
jgi:peptidoglycan hydrolase CwlO-like protein